MYTTQAYYSSKEFGMFFVVHIEKKNHCEHGPNSIIGISLNPSALQNWTRIMQCDAHL